MLELPFNEGYIVHPEMANLSDIGVGGGDLDAFMRFFSWVKSANSSFSSLNSESRNSIILFCIAVMKTHKII
jgi:hypothetical protein